MWTSGTVAIGSAVWPGDRRYQADQDDRRVGGAKLWPRSSFQRRAMDLNIFAELLRRLSHNSSNAGERVGTLVDKATSVAVAALAAELGVDLGRADVIGVNLTCSVDQDPEVFRARVLRLEPTAGLGDELTRYGQALAEVEVQIDADSQPRGVVVLTVEIGSDPA